MGKLSKYLVIDLSWRHFVCQQALLAVICGPVVWNTSGSTRGNTVPPTALTWGSSWRRPAEGHGYIFSEASGTRPTWNSCLKLANDSLLLTNHGGWNLLHHWSPGNVALKSLARSHWVATSSVCSWSCWPRRRYQVEASPPGSSDAKHKQFVLRCELWCYHLVRTFLVVP